MEEAKNKNKIVCLNDCQSKQWRSFFMPECSFLLFVPEEYKSPLKSIYGNTNFRCFFYVPSLYHIIRPMDVKTKTVSLVIVGSSNSKYSKVSFSNGCRQSKLIDN
jgi:hypothetical protein